MAWAEAKSGVCRIHPFEDPQPGICPSCLRERLSRLAGGAGVYSDRYYAISSSSNYFYSDDDDDSPPDRSLRRRRHQRVASDVIGSMYLAVSGNLNKSRSTAAYGRRTGGLSENLKRKKKTGFWNKLLLRG